jgi:aquaporin Z
LGIFWLVLGGCDSDVLTAAFPNVGTELLSISLGFGLTMVFVFGRISSGHFNLAVTIGLWLASPALFVGGPALGQL